MTLPGPPREPRSAVPPAHAFVLNPGAGRGLAGRSWPALERELHARGIAHRMVVAGSAAEALAQVAALPEGEGVVAVGGDGTIHGLLPAVMGTGRPLGIVPLGSGNDFAALLGLKPGDLGGALDRLALPPRPFDGLRAELNGRQVPVLNGLGMGFDAQVAALMRLAPRRLSGFGRYLWAALRAIRELSLSEVEVVVDGETIYQGPSCLVAVMNGWRYGGGFRIAPGADPRDGLFDVVLGTRVNRLELLRLLGLVLRGSHLDDPRVRCARGHSVCLRWERPTHTHLDGELAGEVSELRVSLEPAALLIQG